MVARLGAVQVVVFRKIMRHFDVWREAGRGQKEMIRSWRIDNRKRFALMINGRVETNVLRCDQGHILERN